MPLTAAELSALPERKDYVEEVRADGMTVRHRIPPKFCARKTEGDDVILFHDADGSWIVDYHLEGGPYKRRAGWL